MNLKDENIYILDANAFYNYFENDSSNSQIDTLNFAKDMNVNKIKVLPSCSLIEILLKNKNKHSKINSIIDFIFEKKIYICRSQYAYFNTKTLANLRSMDPICRNIFLKRKLI